jgi:7,8-dihydropterin-6-yl-methyl-4-(beta-D-ribofuranosyl)aminobenzene 5'-phosphate synthase
MRESMKIRILAEGSTKWQRLIKHWGLSILIDDDILFDTFGKPGYVLKQLKRFGADPDKIKHIAISHDDWDHISGLWELLERNKSAMVYMCPNFGPDSKSRIRWCAARSLEVDKLTEIRKDIYLSGELKGGSRRGVALPEQYLAIRTPKGTAVITGCAHPGIVEIVRHAKTAFGQEVNLLAGGFHLKDRTRKETCDIILKLKELGIGRVIPFHCTGRIAQRLFKKEFKGDCIIPKEGQVIEI